ncbi:hypothetical protein [Thiohalophilus sp.]|uniref:hypothetical protein n=1 Tax=Thiohalophilus sp. TaxID=3028392 RepID=UPI002ACEAF64|nr:hypothetical protein [Thiohalophilus sp.]MDZ7663015.1 hypothetical protein [Thiohalophilus sp.]
MNYQPSQDSLIALESLRKAVSKALERKRLLNQYAVIWQDGKPVIIGELPKQAAQVQEDAAKYGKHED